MHSDAAKAAAGNGEEPWLDLRFGIFGNAAEHIGEGWAAPSEHFNWTLGQRSTLVFPRPRNPRGTRFSLQASPLHWPGTITRQRMILSVNDRHACQFTFDGPDQRVAVTDLAWSDLEGFPVTTLQLDLPDATSPHALGMSEDRQVLAFACTALRISDAGGEIAGHHLWPDATAPQSLGSGDDPASERSALLRNFESLGFTCEFGLVQQAFGVHTLGLLRFASVAPQNAAKLLQDGLADFGRQETLSIEPAPDGEMIVRERRHDIAFHTGNYVGKGLSESALLIREAKRLARLAQKLQEDIETGDKMFVLLDEANSDRDVARLRATLAAHGSSELLWIRQPFGRHHRGDVFRLAPGLLCGFVPHRGAFDVAPGNADLDLEAWVAVCEQALELRATLP